MVGRSRKRRARETVSGNHQRCWIWGRHLVLETLAARRWPVLEVDLAIDLPRQEVQRVFELTQGLSMPVVQLDRAALARRCPREDHQGYLARVATFPYADVTDVLSSLPADPLVTILDGIQDPFNFGAILRSAEVFGVQAAFVGSHGQADVSSHVARASAGAINRLPVVRTELRPLVDDLKARGLQVLGASEKATRTIEACDLTKPTALIVGNEGRGLSAEVAAACTSLVRIPQYGEINSLNAAAAAAVLFYEARRQRSR